MEYVLQTAYLVGCMLICLISQIALKHQIEIKSIRKTQNFVIYKF